MMFDQLMIWDKRLFTSVSSLGERRVVHLGNLRANLYPDLFLQWQVKPDDLLVQLGVEYESLGELGRQLRPAALNRLPLPPLAVGNYPVSTVDLLIGKSTRHNVNSRKSLYHNLHKWHVPGCICPGRTGH